jgi:uncharacterized Zn finger protein
MALTSQAFSVVVDTTHVRKVVLEYPNGRRHEIEFDGEERLEVGDSFDLYGRRWRVTSVASPRRPGSRRYLATDAIICRPITNSPLTEAKPGTDQPAI